MLPIEHHRRLYESAYLRRPRRGIGCLYGEALLARSTARAASESDV
ncbi:hypothetical protein [Mesorhizobium captivum]|nr:hypothetical protein [Mesorhizobium sp. VK22E]